MMTERRSDEELIDAAENRYPALAPDFEELTYPRSALREFKRGAFIEGARWAAGVADTVPDRPSGNDVFEALADRLGDHPAAHNHYDYSDEPTTRITLQEYDVEVLAEYLAPAVLALLMGGEKP